MEKSENGLNTEQSAEQHKIPKGKRKRSHSESEVDDQKHKGRKRRRTISESSVDSGEIEQHVTDVSSSVDIKRKRKDSKSGEEGTEREKNEQAGLASEQDGKDKRGKKSVRWQEGGEQKSIEKEGSGVKARKRPHANSADDDESVKQKRKKMGDKSDSNSKNSAEESGEDETGNDSKIRKKRKRKKKEKKETRLPHLRVISKLVTFHSDQVLNSPYCFHTFSIIFL